MGGVVDEPARAGGQQPQHLLELGRIDSDPADLWQVAGEDRLDVGPEVARPESLRRPRSRRSRRGPWAHQLFYGTVHGHRWFRTSDLSRVKPVEEEGCRSESSENSGDLEDRAGEGRHDE